MEVGAHLYQILTLLNAGYNLPRNISSIFRLMVKLAMGPGFIHAIRKHAAGRGSAVGLNTISLLAHFQVLSKCSVGKQLDHISAKKVKTHTGKWKKYTSLFSVQMDKLVTSQLATERIQTSKRTVPVNELARLTYI